jgi:acetyl-CoA carboxylase biotin carboxylase subunit
MAREVAEEVGFPLMVKAAAGGGGKGMRVVRAPSELRGALETAASEAQKAFGDPAVYLEKFVERPRPRHMISTSIGGTSRTAT